MATPERVRVKYASLKLGDRTDHVKFQHPLGDELSICVVSETTTTMPRPSNPLPPE
jgi:hypothetical protein